jgi:hypothetical protein
MRPRRDSFPKTDGEGKPERGPDGRIGGTQGPSGVQGWTKAELVEACGLSAKTFDTVRKAARVRGPSHGGLNWVFSREDVEAMIHRAESGRFTEVGPGMADAWRKLMQGGGGAEGDGDGDGEE